MSHKFLIVALLLGAAIVLGALAWFGFTATREELARPRERTRLVLRFEPAPADLEVARRCLRERLGNSAASEVGAASRGTNEVIVEYRPPADPEAAEDLAVQVLRRGRLRLLVRAEALDYEALGSTAAREQEKLVAWRKAHAGSALGEFGALTPEAGGPVRGLIWSSMRNDKSVADAYRPAVPLVEPKPEWRFGSSDLANVSPASDSRGAPAVGFQFRANRQRAFGDFTESIVDRGMAFVVDDEIVTIAAVSGRLSGSSMLDGGRSGFTRREAGNLIRLLRSGELPSKPVLVSSEQVEGTRNPRWILSGLATVGSGLAALGAIVVALSRLRARPSVEEASS